jgi:hypothetical protein
MRRWVLGSRIEKLPGLNIVKSGASGRASIDTGQEIDAETWTHLTYDGSLLEVVLVCPGERHPIDDKNRTQSTQRGRGGHKVKLNISFVYRCSL